jgi:hypothetical protein
MTLYPDEQPMSMRSILHRPDGAPKPRCSITFDHYSTKCISTMHSPPIHSSHPPSPATNPVSILSSLPTPWAPDDYNTGKPQTSAPNLEVTGEAKDPPSRALVTRIAWILMGNVKARLRARGVRSLFTETWVQNADVCVT